MDEFYKNFFFAIDDYLSDSATPKEEIDRLLAPCAKRCAESFPLELYLKAFSASSSVQEVLETLSASFKGLFHYQIHADKIEIIYTACACDLVKDGLVKSPRLCRCSELSLLYIWRRLYGDVRLCLKDSILSGGKRCLFELRVKELGHY